MSHVSEAEKIVRKLFADKVRKGSGAPYLCHLYSVCGTVASYGGRDVTQAAALLHDTLEDTIGLPIPIDGVADEVMRIVMKVTETKSLPWKERKQQYIEMCEGCCQGVAIVVIADKIDNLRSFTREMMADVADGYWSRFNAGYSDQHWFHGKVIDALVANARLESDGADHPDLRTWDALAELEAAFDHFETVGSWAVDDLADREAAKAALADVAEHGTEPWESVKAKLGLG